MENNHKGWIKLHRKTLDSRVFSSPELLKVWVWCLLRANHSGRWVPVKTGRGASEVFVSPGQFIFGRKTAAEELSMKPSTLRNHMSKLVNIENLDIQPDRHFSVVSIVNWDTYQGDADEVGQATGQAKDNQRTGKGQSKDTNKNEKNEKNEKKKTLPRDIVDFVREYQKWARSEDGHGRSAPAVTDTLIENGAKAIDMLIRIDGFDQDEIFEAIRWASCHHFWGRQIRSLAGLRKKNGDGIMKFENLIAAMKSGDRTKSQNQIADAVNEFINMGRKSI